MRPVFDHAALERIDTSRMPPRTFITVRDRTPIAARVYESKSDVVIVALHGSSAEGTYFHAMAESLRDIAETWSVDLRGHGASSGPRGDVAYIGQLEDDLDDVIAAIHWLKPRAKIVMLGHSSGGGLVLRWAGRSVRPHADAFILLAPYLGPTAPTTRPNSGGWAIVDAEKTIAIVRGDQGQDQITLRFQKPESEQTGREVLAYTFRMMTSFAPHPDLGADIRSLDAPSLLLVGSKDEAFEPERYADLFAQAKILDGIRHLEIVVSPRSHEEIRAFLTENTAVRRALTAA